MRNPHHGWITWARSGMLIMMTTILQAQPVDTVLQQRESVASLLSSPQIDQRQPFPYFAASVLAYAGTRLPV